MSRAVKNNRFVWLGLGVVVGCLSTGLLPQTPLYATATHGQEGFAIATGSVDDGLEGVYVLDYLTGDLKGAALNINSRTFTNFYEYNILKDFEAIKSPRFLMVTGVADIRRGAQRVRMGLSVVYVADVTSGVVAAYGVPYDPASASRSTVVKGQFIPLDRAKFRTVQIRQ